MACQDIDEDEMLFLESFPAYQIHSKPQSVVYFKLWVFSSKDDEGSQNNLFSFSDDVGTRMRIHDKVISAFSKLWSREVCIVQLWAPVRIGGRLLLSTYRQPFAVSYLDKNLLRYRQRCEEYGYNVNTDDMIEQDEDRRPKIISNGPPLSAFSSRLPEMLTLYTNIHHEVGPLLGYGYDECELITSLMMPISDPSQSSSSSDCIGVVECSFTGEFDLTLIRDINEALKKVGLSVFNVQHRIPYQSISGLKLTRDQIEMALETICESLSITLAQVWISYEDDNHEHFSSSLMGTQMKQMLALKLSGYNCIDNEHCSDFSWRLNEYDNACDMIALRMGDGLALKTLQDHQPRFYKDYSKLHTDKLLDWASSEYDPDKSSGLVICLRSINTGELCYAFKFLWIHNPNCFFFLEALLFTLKRCLPHFKFATGAELGDELHVIDVDNSTKSETKTFKIFNEIRLLSTPEAMEKGKKAMVVDNKAPFKAKRDTSEKPLSREEIARQYGKTLKEAAAALGVSESTLKRKRDQFGMGAWQGPDLPQRKANNSSRNQSKRSQTNEECNGAIQDLLLLINNEDIVTIKAEYADHMAKFQFSLSEATYANVEKCIGMKFKLTPGNFKLEYLDEDDDWILLDSDRDMNLCIKCSKKVDRTLARLRVYLHNH